MAHNTGHSIAKALTLGSNMAMAMPFVGRRTTPKKKKKSYTTPDMKLSKKFLKSPDHRLSNKNKIKGTSSRTSVDATLRKKKASKTARAKRKAKQRYSGIPNMKYNK